MPYNNAYNRQIADDINSINERYATLYAYSPVDGRENPYAEGGSSAGVLFQKGSSSKRDGEDNIYNNHNDLPPVYYWGNDSEGMEGGSGFGASTFRDTGYGESLGAGAEGQYVKGGAMCTGSAMCNCPCCCDRKIGGSKKDGRQFGRNVATELNHGVMEGGAWYNDVLSTISNIGSAVAPFAPLLMALGKPHPTGGSHLQELGRIMGEDMERGMKGGAWYNDVLKGISDVGSIALKVAPFLLALGKPKKMKGRGLAENLKKIGDMAGAYGKLKDSMPGASHMDVLKTVDSAFKKMKMKGGDLAQAEISAPEGAGVCGGAILGNPDPYPRQGNSERVAGRGRGRPKGSKKLTGSNGDLLAMPDSVMSNGVPPKQMLRGSYGGKKPSAKDKKIIASVKKMMGGEKKILPGVTRMPAEMKEGGKRVNKRAEIVKEYMKKHGCKMIEASRKVKELGLYKKD